MKFVTLLEEYSILYIQVPLAMKCPKGQCEGITLNSTPELLVVIHWSNPALFKYNYLIFN